MWRLLCSISSSKRIFTRCLHSTSSKSNRTLPIQASFGGGGGGGGGAGKRIFGGGAAVMAGGGVSGFVFDEKGVGKGDSGNTNNNIISDDDAGEGEEKGSGGEKEKKPFDMERIRQKGADLSEEEREFRLRVAFVDARASDLNTQIRCLTCDNNTIEDANTEIAILLREIVREEIWKGKTDQEIKDLLVEQFGEEVTFDAPESFRAIVYGVLPAVTGIAYFLIQTGIYKRSRPHLYYAQLCRGFPSTHKELTAIKRLVALPPKNPQMYTAWMRFRETVLEKWLGLAPKGKLYPRWPSYGMRAPGGHRAEKMVPYSIWEMPGPFSEKYIPPRTSSFRDVVR
eukprot:Nk52_evm20s226 gene=Nk52_evmTU20s226